MQIVIDIPKEKYLYAKSLVNGGKENNPIVLAIGNGTPLPTKEREERSNENI